MNQVHDNDQQLESIQLYSCCCVLFVRFNLLKIMYLYPINAYHNKVQSWKNKVELQQFSKRLCLYNNYSIELFFN